jgi:hypothetical protein
MTLYKIVLDLLDHRIIKSRKIKQMFNFNYSLHSRWITRMNKEREITRCIKKFILQLEN